MIDVWAAQRVAGAGHCSRVIGGTLHLWMMPQSEFASCRRRASLLLLQAEPPCGEGASQKASGRHWGLLRVWECSQCGEEASTFTRR